MGKGFDNLSVKVAMLEAENKVLRTQRDQLKKRKRAAVETDLNKIFVTVQNIRRTRKRVTYMISELDISPQPSYSNPAKIYPTPNLESIQPDPLLGISGHLFDIAAHSVLSGGICHSAAGLVSALRLRRRFRRLSSSSCTLIPF